MGDFAQVIEDLLAGDDLAADQVVTVITNHLAWIGAYAARDSWDDLVQEVMISLLRSPPRARASGAIIRHIQTTTYRKFVDEMRRERGQRRRAGPGGSHSEGWRRNVSFQEGHALDEAEDFWAKQLDPSLREAMERLEERKRLVIEHRYMLGCTNEEGAARLGIPLGTYKRLLGQGLSELREVLLPPGSPAREGSTAGSGRRKE